jgi:mRNA-degrading endonuclease RelE of RelBE toxin-antitoxin system
LFTVFFSDDFKKHFEKLTKKDVSLKNRLRECIDEMAVKKPYSQIGYSGDLNGKWKMRVGDYRLIYVYCEDCRRCCHQVFNDCYRCCDRSGDVLIFFDVIHRSNDYKL